MRAGFEVDWAFAVQRELEKLVKEQRPEEIHRWPLLQAFDAEAYLWEDQILILVLRGKMSGIPHLGAPENVGAEAPSERPSAANVEQWHEYIRKQYDVGPRDMVMIIPTIGQGPQITHDWGEWPDEDKRLWHVQLVNEANRHLMYLRELDARKGIVTKGVPPEISKSLALFQRDHPEPGRTGFLMMRLSGTTAHDKITKAVRATATAQGLLVVRAGPVMGNAYAGCGPRNTDEHYVVSPTTDEEVTPPGRMPPTFARQGRKDSLTCENDPEHR